MKPREHAFTDIDAQPDPVAWVEVLDRVGQEPLYAAYKRRTVELLDPQPGDRYLEVGMGTGTDALACAERFGVDVVGTDSSSVMVEEATRRGLREAVVADAHALPFESDSFHGAWADRAFQHLADPVAALGEMVRVTKPGGRIVVVDPDTERRPWTFLTRSLRSACSASAPTAHSAMAGWLTRWGGCSCGRV